MEESKALTQILVWVLGISGSIILLCLGIIGYFIKAYDHKQEKVNDKLFGYFDRQELALSKLDKSIAQLDGTISVIRSEHNALDNKFEAHKDVCGYPHTQTSHKKP
jgi:hypothetical protein